MDQDRLRREALAGDKEAADRMIREALRAGDWDLVGLIGMTIAKGESLIENLTDYQRLRLGEKNFEGRVKINNFELTSLPEGLKINGSLILRGTCISTLPQDIEVSGTLDLRDTPLATIPDNFHIEGSLNISGTEVEKLPEGLVVGRNLNIRRTRINSFPDDIKIGNNLYLCSDLKIIKKEDIPGFKGKIYFMRGF